MARSASASPLGPDFDDFLFAQIGEDGNGMLFSVLSALARMDVDPWQEAAQLARLPKDTATQRLSSLIAALPGGLAEHLDPATIAARLIALLPRRVSSNVASPETARSINAATKSPYVAYAILFFMAITLGGLFLIASQLSARVGTVDAPAYQSLDLRAQPSASGR